MGGLGLRSSARNAAASYVSAWGARLPSIAKAIGMAGPGTLLEKLPALSDCLNQEAARMQHAGVEISGLSEALEQAHSPAESEAQPPPTSIYN